MEMNHKLFDECSQKYKLEKQKEKEKLRDRDSAWTKIESKARQNPNVNQHIFSSCIVEENFVFSIKSMQLINRNFIDLMTTMMTMVSQRISLPKKSNKKQKK